MTDEQFQASTLDIFSGEKPEDVPLFTSAASFRKEALHLFGVDELSTNELFEYFKDYKPLAVEWINDWYFSAYFNGSLLISHKNKFDIFKR